MPVAGFDPFEGYEEERNGAVSKCRCVGAGFAFEGKEAGEVGDLEGVDRVGGGAGCDGC